MKLLQRIGLVQHLPHPVAVPGQSQLRDPRRPRSHHERQVHQRFRGARHLRRRLRFAQNDLEGEARRRLQGDAQGLRVRESVLGRRPQLRVSADDRGQRRERQPRHADHQRSEGHHEAAQGARDHPDQTQTHRVGQEAAR